MQKCKNSQKQKCDGQNAKNSRDFGIYRSGDLGILGFRDLKSPKSPKISKIFKSPNKTKKPNKTLNKKKL